MTDVYVQRDGDGRIVGIYAMRQPGYAEEALSPDHPEVGGFQQPGPTAAQQARQAALVATRAKLRSAAAGGLPEIKAALAALSDIL